MAAAAGGGRARRGGVAETPPGGFDVEEAGSTRGSSLRRGRAGPAPANLSRKARVSRGCS
jgi:hypothetical protein